MSNLEFGILGPLVVRRDGEVVPIGSGKQRAVLGILLVHRDEVVSTDRLIDEMWRDDEGRDHQNALWVHISNLRKALHPGTDQRTSTGVLTTQAPGYALHVDDESLDSSRFERLVAEGRALIDTDPAVAAIVLAEALALWRGRALEDFTYESWAQPEIRRLEELRLEAVESRIDADLRVGRRRELIGELESLVRRHPDREGLTASLMVALHGAGRTGDALRTYRHFRERLGQEFGVEPSAALERLHTRIVTGDPSLDQPSSTAPAAKTTTGPSVRGYEIRDRIGERGSGVLYRAFQQAVGREVVVKVINPQLADDPQFVQRFEAEAQLVARLEHPHVVPIYDYWREPGRAYVVMRYMSGGTLRQRLADGRPLARDELARFVDQLGSALEAAHDIGVRHGHVNAGSVLFDEVGNTYLGDFEIAVGSRVNVGAGPSAVDTADDVRGFAELVAQAATGRMDPMADLLVGLDAALGEVLQEAVEPSGPAQRIDVADVRAELTRIMHLPSAPTTPSILPNPYKGLRSFQEADADHFFGRERFVDRLIARLGRTGRAGRFVAVVGPSGSGKSSVVTAGLLPALRAGAVPGSDRWYVVGMTPGVHPFEELEDALLGVAVRSHGSLLATLAEEHGIQRGAAHVLPADDGHLLLVIDQFEELFTLTPPDTAVRFMDALEDALSDDHARITVIVTLRADFYDRPLRHRGVGELMRMGTEVLTPMSPGELERAVTGPATRVGATCEAELVSELVSAASDRPSALPLLQYALTEIFERRSDANVLRAASYRDVGGLAGALVDRAEAIYTALGPDERAATEQVFLRLVALSEVDPPTRRRVLMSELTSMSELGRFVESIVDTFARHRLLSYDRDPVSRGTTVEISHETLLTAWSRLANWLDRARSDVADQRRLAEAAAEWADRDRSDDFVLRGGRLATYHGWIDAPPVALTGTERDLLVASEDAERSRRVLEVEQASRDARLRRRSLLLVGLAAVTAVVVGVAGFAIAQQRRSSDLASRIAAESEARRLAADAQLLLGDAPEQAMATAILAARATAGRGEVLPEAMDALYASLHGAGVSYPMRDGPVAVRPAAGGGVFVMTPNDLVGVLQEELDDTADPGGDDCGGDEVSACAAARETLPAGLTITGGEDAYFGARSDHPLAGTSVRVVAPGDGPLLEALRSNFVEFTARTGIEVDVRSGRRDENTVDEVVPREFDLVELAQPGGVPENAATELIDLSGYLDRDDLEDAWGSYLTSLVSVGTDGTWPSSTGSVYGVWTRLDLKTLLWYDPVRFDGEGERPPTDWSETVRMSDRMAAAGETPWCIGTADGWPATDLLESILLRKHGPDVYDRWWRHDIPFDDPLVVDAARTMNELLFTPGYLPPGGAALTTQLSVDAPAFYLVDDPPTCLMAPMASWIGSIGLDIAAADFPAIDARFGDAEVGSGTFMVATSDRPEVRALVEFIASPEYGSGGVPLFWIPPNVHFDLGRLENDEARTMAAGAYAAIRADQFRFDATDLMPSHIGASAAPEAMIDWLRQGPDSVERIFAGVEAAWDQPDPG